MAAKAALGKRLTRAAVAGLAVGIFILTGFGLAGFPASEPAGEIPGSTGVSEPLAEAPPVAGKGPFYTGRSFESDAPFGPLSERTSLSEAQQRSRAKVLVPEDARASRDNLSAAWLSSDGRAWLQFSSGVEVSISYMTTPNGFEVDWTEQIASEGFPGRFVHIREGILAVAVDASETNRSTVFWEEDGASYAIYGNGETVGQLIAVANSMK